MTSSFRFSDWPLLARGFIILCIVSGFFLGAGLVVALIPSIRTSGLRTILSVMGTTVAADDHGLTNMLLLGVGDLHHDGADLTDTMIVASIDEATQSAVLLSLPRDLLIDSQERIVGGRINAMYANEKRRLEIREKMPEEQAALQALQTLGEQIGEKLGIHIHGVLKADFTAFTETVDALGGVDVDVPEPIMDYTYPIGENQTGLFEVEEGMQHFDGETALRYARSRHSTSDFDRSARQQLLLSALGAKVKSLSLADRIRVASDVYQRLQEHVLSTFTPRQMLLLAQIGSTLRRDRIITMQLNFYSGGDNSEAQAGGFVVPAPAELYEGASVLLPLGLPGKAADWKQIRTFTALLLRERQLYISNPVFEIRDAGAPPLQAWKLRNELLRYGLQVLPINDISTGSGATDYVSAYYRDADFEPSASFAGRLLSIPVARMTDVTDGSGNVMLLLGAGFKFKPFVTLSGAVLR